MDVPFTGYLMHDCSFCGFDLVTSTLKFKIRLRNRDDLDDRVGENTLDIQTPSFEHNNSINGSSTFMLVMDPKFCFAVRIFGRRKRGTYIKSLLD
ncbi:hypothetical protein EV363DRAFT_1168009 [Boletus edulis]|uniref:Uncharacterized protein n=1 Tax=Boletus edulis BED1 TaxID=1328754 RepID=A0AAD4GCN2_BOLED|nr:hypothetical protein EV363DRAFT_1168009 [Boletus edulis]KAF8435502.1 hypothetical protein L210DRAFT_365463 [Boletus edulis BED1]